MKRMTFILIVFLILGMLLTTLVAWTLSAYQKLNVGFMTTGSFVRTQELLWSVRTYSQTGALRVNSRVVTERRPHSTPQQAPHWSRASLAPTREEYEADLSVEERAYGWPILSHFYRKTLDENRRVIIEWGATVPSNSQNGRTNSRELPLRPIWSGFALNTIFYASLLWLVTLGTFTSRRMIRRKRSFCIECGYNLRGDFSTGCPECGLGREKTDASYQLT